MGLIVVSGTWLVEFNLEVELRLFRSFEEALIIKVRRFCAILQGLVSCFIEGRSRCLTPLDFAWRQLVMVMPACIQGLVQTRGLDLRSLSNELASLVALV